MRNLFLKATLLFVTLTSTSSCGLDCVDKKTGMHKSSRTLKEAQDKDLFRFEFVANKSTFELDSGLVFTIKNAWVENSWKYECINNKAEVVKDRSIQFVVDAEYKGNAIFSNYWLGNNHLGAILHFGYSDEDTLKFLLCKGTSYTQEKLTIIDTITFVKRQVSR